MVFYSRLSHFFSKMEANLATKLFIELMSWTFPKDPSRATMLQEKWNSTPWMIRYKEPEVNSTEWFDFVEKMEAEFGIERSRRENGSWQRGGAIVYGINWIGFSKEDELNKFQTLFPDLLIEN